MGTTLHMVTGFLESGKTTYINGMLKTPEYNEKNVLVIVCEEGTCDLDAKTSDNMHTVYIDKEEELTAPLLASWEGKYHPDMAIIEFNGMWKMEDFYKTCVKADWDLVKITVLAEAGTFIPYCRNMGTLMSEKLNNADVLIFNRCTDKLKESLRLRGLQYLNDAIKIFFENEDGQLEPYESEDFKILDLSQDIVEITDAKYAFWYKDMLHDPKKYDGIRIKAKLLMRRTPRFPGEYLPGRIAMVCCENDMQYFGFIARGEMLEQFKSFDWFEATGVIKAEEHKAYGGVGPVFYVEEAAKCYAPDQEYVGF